jgi:hypothetical protein
LVSKRKQIKKERSRTHWISYGHSPFSFSLGSLATEIGPGERKERRKVALPSVVQAQRRNFTIVFIASQTR